MSSQTMYLGGSVSEVMVERREAKLEVGIYFFDQKRLESEAAE